MSSAAYPCTRRFCVAAWREGERRRSCTRGEMDLELGHVGNPIAETTDEASDEALVVLPPQMQRFGKLLSTPTGRPTPACWLIGAVLALYPLAGLLVGVGIPSVLSRAVDGDTQLAIQFGLIYGGVLAAGPVALHALFMVTRQPQGHLTRFLKGLASLMVFLIAAFDGLFASLGLVLSAATGFAYFACFFSTLFLWWYSLKVASALTAAPVAVANDKARAVATWLREDGGSMDLQTWRPEVEAPVLELVRNTLPTLSDGWGRSVGVIMIGLVCFALGLFLALKANFAIGTALWLQAVCAGLIGGLVSLPFLLAIDPASASSNCARLEDSINHIGGEDSSFMPAENFIKYIKRVNKDQGLGASALHSRFCRLFCSLKLLVRANSEALTRCSSAPRLRGVWSGHDQADALGWCECVLRHDGGLRSDAARRSRTRVNVRCGREPACVLRLRLDFC
jgi:hypothetical protein